MMKKILYIATAAAALTTTPAFAGVDLSTSAGMSAAPAGATTVINFNNPPGSTTEEANSKGYQVAYVGDAGRMDATGESPFGGSPKYLFVAPTPQDGGFFGVGGISDGVFSSVTFQGTEALSSISVFIGSLDAYNVVELIGKTGELIATYNGEQINNGVAPAFPGGAVNVRATFTATDETKFYGAKFYNNTTQGSFEFDNLAFTAAVPEPATWAMMMLGFAMVGGAARYRRRSTNVRFA